MRYGILLMAIIYGTQIVHAAEQPTPNVAIPTENIMLQINQETAKKLRDPFQFSEEKSDTQENKKVKFSSPFSPNDAEYEKRPEKEKALILHGVFEMPGERPVAIINNRLVRQWQKVDGWQVIRVRSDRVVVKKGSKQRTLVMPSAKKADRLSP